MTVPKNRLISGALRSAYVSNSPAINKNMIRPQSAKFPSRPVGGLFASTTIVMIGDSTRSVYRSLVVLVIAFIVLSGYTCVAIRRKEFTTMSAKKNLCAMIDIDLHRKITEAKD
jgi:hypothetical protein